MANAADGVPLCGSRAFISCEDNVTWGHFGFLHAMFLFHAKMLLCFYTTCGPKAFGNLLFGSHISNVQILQKNFSLPSHNATYVLHVCTSFSSCCRKQIRTVITSKFCLNKRIDFFSREVYFNNNLYCCKTLRYHLIRGTSEQADTAVSDAESVKEAAYEHRCKYSLSHHHLC